MLYSCTESSRHSSRFCVRAFCANVMSAYDLRLFPLLVSCADASTTLSNGNRQLCQRYRYVSRFFHWDDSPVFFSLLSSTLSRPGFEYSGQAVTYLFSTLSTRK